MPANPSADTEERGHLRSLVRVGARILVHPDTCGILGVWIRLKLREEDCTVELAERASAKGANMAPAFARLRKSWSTAPGM